MKTCSKCKYEKNISEFYSRSNRNGTPYPECKLCFTNRVNTNIRKKKVKAIKYLGNKCVDCDQSHHPAIYDFHHINDNKEADWSKMQKLSFEKIKKELNKCVLLCSNCHRLRHTKKELWEW